MVLFRQMTVSENVMALARTPLVARPYYVGEVLWIDSGHELYGGCCCSLFTVTEYMGTGKLWVEVEGVLALIHKDCLRKVAPKLPKRGRTSRPAA